jgi:hypothetical protein
VGMRRPVRHCCKWGGLAIVVALAAALEISLWWDLSWMSPRGWSVGFVQGSVVVYWSVVWLTPPVPPTGFQVWLHGSIYTLIEWTWLPTVGPGGYYVVFPVWILLVAGSLLVGPLWWRDHLAVRFRRGGRCPQCGYARRGLAAETKCPECGTPLTK